MNILKAFYKPKGLVFQWIFSYIVLLCISILFIFFSYSLSSNILENEISRSNSFMLSVLQDRTNNTFNNIDSIIDSMLKIKLRNLSLHTNSYTNIDSYNLGLLSADLAGLKTVARDLDNYFIFFENLDAIVSPSNVLDSEMHYKIYFEDSDLSYNQWRQIINNDTQMTIIPVSYSNGQKNYLHVNKTSFDLHFGKQFASMVFVIDGEKMKLPNNILGQTSEARVLMTDHSGNIFNFSDDRTLDKFTQNNVYKKNNLNYTEIDNQKYVILMPENKSSNMQYFCAVPSSVFLGNLSKVRIIYILISFILAFLGAFLSVYFARRNYNPVGALLNTIKKQQILNLEGNEFEIISHAFTDTLSERKRLSLKVEKQSDILKSVFLMRWLKGTTNPKVPLYEAFSTYNLDFTDDGLYTVLLFNIDDMTSFSPETEEPEEELNLVKFIITNIFMEFVAEKHYGVMTDVDEILTCIVNFKTASYDDAKNDILHIYKKSSDFIAKQFQIHFSLASGNITDDLNDIPLIYSEALNVFDYKAVIKNKNAIFPGDIEETKTDINDYSKTKSQLEKRIMNYISAHYSEFNLSVSQIADYLNMHPSYISSAFKETVGEGILEIINKTRCERAAELLIVGDKSIQEVSKDVGYVNVRTFARVFKKYYGLTPSQYKENALYD